MVDMLLAGDRALVRVKHYDTKEEMIQTWTVENHPWKISERVATWNGITYKVWFDGKNYRVGRYVVIARA